MIGFMLVGFIVNSKLKAKFKKYSKISTLSSMSGKEIAEKMLSDYNIKDVKIVSVQGRLTDHYNPIDKTINLSKDVYQGRNISALAIASHECGHAVQHATAYKWLNLRSQMVPLVSISSKMMSMIFLIGIIGGSYIGLGFTNMLMLFIILQLVITFFTLITLPVEFDASKRALIWLRNSGITNKEEIYLAKDALKWAANTYLIAALAAITYLLYYISILKD